MSKAILSIPACDAAGTVAAFARLTGIARGVADGLLVGGYDGRKAAAQALLHEAERAEVALHAFTAAIENQEDQP